MNWKPIEPTLHRIMGALAALTNTRWLWLERRERKQLPPENNENPAVILVFPGNGKPPLISESPHNGWPQKGKVRWYWSSFRVMDTLDDLRQYDQGGTLGWFGTVGLGVLIGWWIWG